VIATYQWQSQAPTTWENLRRHRFEFGLAVSALALGLLVWTQIDRDTPTDQDIEQSLQTYVQAIRASRSINGGSLGMEMQADVTGPRVSSLDISQQRQFINYWTIDAVMHLDSVGAPAQDVPIRLRVMKS